MNAKKLAAQCLALLLSCPGAYAQQPGSNEPAPRATAPVRLDLSSRHRTIAASQAGAFNTATLRVGRHTRTVASSDMVTPAELLALQQVLRSGEQSLALGRYGRARGGSFQLDSQLSQSISDLVIPRNVTLLHDFATGATVHVLGNLTNAGTLQAISTNPDVVTANLAATNIFNQRGAVLTSVIPASGALSTQNLVGNMSLSLTALNDIVNAGVIRSAGNLTMSAGGSIVNALPAGFSGSMPVIQATGNINLNTANLINSGVIASSVGNINVASQMAQSITIYNVGGQLQALLGAINVRDMLFASKFDLVLTGGDWLSRELNLYGGTGAVDVEVGEVTGQINIHACDAHVIVAAGNLNLGTMQLSGDPTFWNSAGSVTISAPIVTNGAPLAIVATGDIVTAAGAGEISTARTSGNGDGGSILIVAGAAFTSSPSGSTSGTDDTTHTLTLTGPSATGGKIDLATGTAITSLTSNGGTSGNRDGGDIMLVAYAVDAGTGTIKLPTSTFTITTSGLGSGTNGNVTVIADANTAAGINSISVGAIDTTGGSGGGGNISLHSTNVAISGGSVVVNINGAVSSGSFGPGTTARSGAISTGTLIGDDSVIVNGGQTLNINNPISSVGTITLNTNAGSNGGITIAADVTAGTTTTISANGSGSITQTSGTVSGTSVVLSSNTGDIGTSAATRIALNAPDVTATTGGNVYISDSAPEVELLGSSSAGGIFDLLATNSITNNSDSSDTISADTVVLTSSSGSIGTDSDRINVSAANLTANASAIDQNVFLSEANGVELLGNSSAGAVFDLAAGASMTNDSGAADRIAATTVILDSTNGSIGASGAAVNISAANLTAHASSTGQSVYLSELNGVELLDDSDADDTFSLTAGGDITNTTGSSDKIAAGTIILSSSAGSIGSSTNRIVVNAGSSSGLMVTANVDAYIVEDDAVQLLDWSVGGTADLLVSGAGTLAIDGNVSAGDLVLATTNGSITHTSGTLTAASTALSAGDPTPNDGSSNIGAAGAGEAVATNTGSLTAIASGNVYIEQTGTTSLTVIGGAGGSSFGTGRTFSVLSTNAGADLIVQSLNTVNAGSYIFSSGRNLDVGSLSSSRTSGSGNAGDIDLSAGAVLTIGGNLSANGGGTGSSDGGTVTVEGNSITTSGTFSISANGKPTGTGAGGSITFEASCDTCDITIESGGLSFAAKGGGNDGDGGSVSLSAGRNLTLSAPSNIDVSPVDGQSKGGTISLVAGSGASGGNLFVNGGLSADGINGGDGGEITLVSNSATPFNLSSAESSNGITSNITANGGNGSISITNAGGAVNIGDRNATAGDIAGELSITAFTDITTSSTSTTLVADTIVLTATTSSIGTAANPILINAGSGSAGVGIAATAASGSIFLKETDSVELLDGATADSAAGTFSLVAGSHISDQFGSGEAITAGTVSLQSVSGSIGSATSAINLSAANLAASASAANQSVYISEADSLEFMGNSSSGAIFSLTAGGSITNLSDPTDAVTAGSVELFSTSGSIGAVGAAINIGSTTGSVNLTAGAMNTGQSIHVKATDSVELLGSSSAGGTFSLSAGIDITNSAGIDIISALAVELVADTGNIGADGSPVLIDTQEVTAIAPSGNVFVFQDSTISLALTGASVFGSGKTFSLETGGDLSVFGINGNNATGTGGTVTLTAAGEVMLGGNITANGGGAVGDGGVVVIEGATIAASALPLVVSADATQTVGGVGAGGSITFIGAGDSSDIILEGGGLTFSAKGGLSGGAGGSVELSAGRHISINSVSNIDVTPSFAGGDGGQMTLTAGTAASTGNIRVFGSLIANGTGSGNGGTIIITYHDPAPGAIFEVGGTSADNFVAGEIHVDALGTGNGGTVSITNSASNDLHLKLSALPVSISANAGSAEKFGLLDFFTDQPVTIEGAGTVIGAVLVTGSSLNSSIPGIQLRIKDVNVQGGDINVQNLLGSVLVLSTLTSAGGAITIETPTLTNLGLIQTNGGITIKSDTGLIVDGTGMIDSMDSAITFESASSNVDVTQLSIKGVVTGNAGGSFTVATTTESTDSETPVLTVGDITARSNLSLSSFNGIEVAAGAALSTGNLSSLIPPPADPLTVLEAGAVESAGFILIDTYRGGFGFGDITFADSNSETPTVLTSHGGTLTEVPGDKPIVNAGFISLNSANDVNLGRNVSLLANGDNILISAVRDIVIEEGTTIISVAKKDDNGRNRFISPANDTIPRYTGGGIALFAGMPGLDLQGLLDDEIGKRTGFNSPKISDGVPLLEQNNVTIDRGGVLKVRMLEDMTDKFTLSGNTFEAIGGVIVLDPPATSHIVINGAIIIRAVAPAVVPHTASGQAIPVEAFVSETPPIVAPTDPSLSSNGLVPTDTTRTNATQITALDTQKRRVEELAEEQDEREIAASGNVNSVVRTWNMSTGHCEPFAFEREDGSTVLASQGTFISASTGKKKVYLKNGKVLVVAAEEHVAIDTDGGTVIVPSNSAVMLESKASGVVRISNLAGEPTAIQLKGQKEPTEFAMNPGEEYVMSHADLGDEELIATDGIDRQPIAGAVTVAGVKVQKNKFNRSAMAERGDLVRCDLGAFSVPMKRRMENLRNSLNGASLRHLPETLVSLDRSGAVNLEKGELLVKTHKGTTIKHGIFNVSIEPGTISLVTGEGPVLKVRNLWENGKSSVRVFVGNRLISTSAGQEIIMTSNDATRRKALAADLVARRRVKSYDLANGNTITRSEVSFASLAGDSSLLHKVLTTNRDDERDITGKMVKMAACLQHVHSHHGPYSNNPK